MQGMGALDGNEALTALGRHLTLMPMDPRLGKALLYAAMLRCATSAPSIRVAVMCLKECKLLLCLLTA